MGLFRKVGWLVLAGLVVSPAARTMGAVGQKPMNVLEPWTPIRYESGVLHVWGRNYMLGTSVLPRQITSGGQSLLAGPISFECRANGKAFSTTAGQVTTDFSSPEEVRLREGFSFDSRIRLTTTLRAEYDGLLDYHIRLRSAPGVSVDNCSLEIPIKSDVASYFQKYVLMNNDWGKQSTHAIPFWGRRGMAQPF